MSDGTAGLPADTTTAADAPCAPDRCAHHWVSQHEPGHALYWVRVCGQCWQPDWDDLDREVAVIAAEAARQERQRIIELAIDQAGKYDDVFEAPGALRLFADLLEGDASA